MVRLFHVYYPIRMLVLLTCEAVAIAASFVMATMLVLGADSYLVLNYEGGALKIVIVVAITLLCSYYLDLYAPQRLTSKSEIYFRLMAVVGIVSIILSAVAFAFPRFLMGPDVLLVGLAILSVVLMLWRNMYDWVVSQPLFREHVYVLGSGERAEHVIAAIRARRDLGMEIVGYATRNDGKALTRDEFAESLAACEVRIDRIVVAFSDRRGTMPVRELLDLRMAGTKIEEATTLLEKMSGKIEIDGLHPSVMIFGDGFGVKRSVMLARRLVAFAVSATALLLLLPFIPWIILAVKLSSTGPVLFRQTRVGQRGKLFTVYKFRTMRQDAEAGTGAVWAQKDDPRVTRIGGFLRKTRLDEIPQLWNVLKGDMGFVGPRPERPEFVQWLTEQIPYYNLRHFIRPGVTGWAQVRYRYGATLEETRQKLEYDLYYVKHMSVALDLLIIFETLKTVLLRRGAQ